MVIDGWAGGFVSYLVCHFLHILLWKIGTIRHDVRALFFVFLILPFGGYALFLLRGSGSTHYAAAAFLHFALAANYIAIYPAFQASSPTLTILDYLYRAKTGRQLDDLVMAAGGKSILADRIEDLKVGKLVYEQANGLVLTAKGNVLAGVFIGYRRFIGLPEGAG